jgi:hypothetical protein
MCWQKLKKQNVKILITSPRRANARRPPPKRGGYQSSSILIKTRTCRYLSALFMSRYPLPE